MRRKMGAEPSLSPPLGASHFFRNPVPPATWGVSEGHCDRSSPFPENLAARIRVLQALVATSHGYSTKVPRKGNK